MTLSPCSQCKNYSDQVCLLGQSYADVFSSMQSMADDQERQRLSTGLASCAYWEESDFSKLFSREVVLSYQAWSRLAYMRVQCSDQELFHSLISAARDVVLQQRQEPNPGLTGTAHLTSPPAITPDAEAAPSSLAVPQPTLPSPQLPTEMATTLEEPTVLPTPPNGLTGSPSSLVGVPRPLSMEMPSLADPHPEVPPLAEADDPIEVAMQELWFMAMSTNNGSNNGHHAGEIMNTGRGTGRINQLDP